MEEIYSKMSIEEIKEEIELCTISLNETIRDNKTLSEKTYISLVEDIANHLKYMYIRLAKKEYANEIEISSKTKEIKVENYKGTFYIIDEAYYKGKKVYLLEHCSYGDEVPWLIVKFENDKPIIILEDVYNGFDDLEDLED